MKLFFPCIAVAFFFTLFFVACDGSGNGAEAADVPETDITETAYDDLPVCINSREGSTAYVKGEKKAYVCENGNWKEDVALTNSTQKKKKGSCGKDYCWKSASEQIPCTEKIACTEAYYEPTGDVFLCDYDKDFKKWEWLIYMDSEGKKQNECWNRKEQESLKAKESKYDAENNTMTDLRDGQVYRTVKIGDQIWMAENLNYVTENSTCPGRADSNCAIYGRLYDNGSVCPGGWTLPSYTDFKLLFNQVGGQSVAGKGLFAGGKDYVGFSARAAGSACEEGSLYGIGEAAVFWTYGDNYSMVVMNPSRVEMFSYITSCRHAFYSVRCIKVLEPGEISSSSSAISSSSVTLATQCKTETEDNCEYGALVDARDGQTYKTVKIGDQWWMAENLNYAYAAEMDSFYYTVDAYRGWEVSVLHDEGDSAYVAYYYTLDSARKLDPNSPYLNCSNCGLLYRWSAAMDSAGVLPGNTANNCGCNEFCRVSGKVRGVCPEGWHLPDSEEFSVLLAAVKTPNNLKSSVGWKEYDYRDSIFNGNGTDEYGFSAFPVPCDALDREGREACFCSSTPTMGNSGSAIYLRIINDVPPIISYMSRFKMCSVRCIKD